jgi:hypothetical protein
MNKLYIAKFLFMINMFDPNMVFRDQESKEIFVFDSNGIWNEDTLKHKLLYWLGGQISRVILAPVIVII